MSSPSLDRFEIRKTPQRGRGVFAKRAYGKGELVELAPVIVMPEYAVRGVLDHYIYRFGERYAIALGVGSLFNHSAECNLSCFKRVARLEISYWANRPITDGEELTIDYGYAPKGYDGR